MDGDVGGNLDCLRQDLPDPAIYLLLLRGRQFEISRDGREMANVVASTHRQAPLDHGLLNIGEPLRPLELRTWPLYVISRRRPIWRRNLVAVQERCPGRANSFLHSRVSQLDWSTERGNHATRLQQRGHARPPTLRVRPIQ